MAEWIFTKELQQRASREGWSLFESDVRGLEVERCDDPGEDGPSDPLADDDVAIALARAAGVPCLDDGTFADEVDVTFECTPEPSQRADDGERISCDECGESFNVNESFCEQHCLKCCDCEEAGR